MASTAIRAAMTVKTAAMTKAAETPAVSTSWDQGGGSCPVCSNRRRLAYVAWERKSETWFSASLVLAVP